MGKINRVMQAFYNRPLAITEAKLSEINAFLEAREKGVHFPGEKTALAVESSGDSEEQRFEVIDGIARIPVFGVLSQRMNLLTWFSGGTSTELLMQDIGGALNRSDVDLILLEIDSPGGNVDGIATLSDFIFDARTDKPIIAAVNPLAASAAYWIASAADKVILSSPTDEVGSIGVVMMHREYSKREEQEGVKTTEIYAGKYKRLVSQYKPLSGEGTQWLQDQVDYIYSIFVEAVARNRGVSVEAALKMADGQIFTGQQAVDAGLADRIEAFDSLINTLKKKGGYSMDLETLKTKHPETYKAAVAVGVEQGKKAGLEEGLKTGKEAGIKAEQERIKSVEDVTMEGYEDVVADVKFDGKTTGEQAAVLILKAQKERGFTVTDIEKDAPVVTQAQVATEQEQDNPIVAEAKKRAETKK
jgi:signal peptide peptidase SppA